MMPLLTYPLALIGAIAIPALVAVYFFRTHFRRHPVSSLLLWRCAHQPREGGSRLQQFALPLSFILELIVLTLLFLAACDPRLITNVGRKPLIVVLDDSASMLAGPRSETPQALATVELRKICARPDTGPIRFIIAGNRPIILEPVKPNATAINNTLKQWKCLASEVCMEKALSLAHELAQNQSRIVVMTDQDPPSGLATDRLLWMSFGNPLPNIGIVNAARSAGERNDRCMLEVANFSYQRAQTLLSVDFGPGIPATKQVLALSTGEVKRLAFSLPHDAQTLHASLSADALAVDNEAFLLPLPSGKVKVAVDIEDDVLRETIQKTLNASEMALPGGASPQLLITDMPVRTNAHPDMWVLRIDAGNNPTSYTGPFVVDNSHPLAKGIDLNGVIWGPGTTNSTVASPPVIAVGDIPVVLDQPFPSGRHVIRMFFRLPASTLQNTPNWPILFWNLLKWRAEESEGLSDVNVRAGAEVVLRLDKATPIVKIRWPDGTDTDIRGAKKRVVIDPAALGICRISAGQAQYHFACNLFSSGESDLRGCSSGKWGQLVDAESLKREYISIGWILLLLSLGVLIAHQAVLRQ